jgi:uncharacterized coiled-coil protein SlyX
MAETHEVLRALAAQVQALAQQVTQQQHTMAEQQQVLAQQQQTIAQHYEEVAALRAQMQEVSPVTEIPGVGASAAGRSQRNKTSRRRLFASAGAAAARRATCYRVCETLYQREDPPTVKAVSASFLRIHVSCLL